MEKGNSPWVERIGCVRERILSVDVREMVEFGVSELGEHLLL